MMNYEKKYKQALERAKECLQDGTITSIAKAYIENIFPELKESEDDKIRKAIHIYLDWLDGRKDYAPKGNYTIRDMIAWLEKQGEQKTADKVEPKFKVGDWVIKNGIVAQILDKQKYGFVGLDIDGKDFFCNYGHTDSMLLWSINDAKDGDLIYVSTEIKGIQAIFHKFENGIMYFHCNLCSDFMQGGYEPSGDIKSVHPLLKTQHQKFFQKMKQAGYEWDAEKKELKKIEPKKLDADKVIAWLVANICDFEYYVKLFKQDFGI
jgi:hypothetical protein